MALNGFRFATRSTDSSQSGAVGTQSGDGVQWLLKRNCSISPAQLGFLYGSLCVVSLGISLYFWLQGAKMVMAFAMVELTAVAAALLVYARHAVDREHIALSGAQLVVELEKAGRVERCEFNREWVRVEPQADDRSLIELSGQGRRVQVGRFVRPELRPALAREIRSALRRVSAVDRVPSPSHGPGPAPA